jgi:hypothetical protein
MASRIAIETRIQLVAQTSNTTMTPLSHTATSSAGSK